MTHDVFISYSTKDKNTADATCHNLEAQGIRCWLAPRDIPHGAEWSEQIIGALDQARVLVLVFSSNANMSKQVMRELSYAADRGLPILPLRIEDTIPSKGFRYYLGIVHWLDALSPPLEAHLGKLADRVSALLETDGRSGHRKTSDGSLRGEDLEKDLLRYREYVEAVWADKELTQGEVEWLREQAEKLNLSSNTAADVESGIMGDTALSVLAEQKEVQTLAFENNVTLSQVKGTGKDGRITKQDIELYVSNRPPPGLPDDPPPGVPD